MTSLRPRAGGFSYFLQGSHLPALVGLAAQEAPCLCWRARSRHRAITLIELAISVALLSIVGYVIISLYPTSILSLKRSHDLLAAAHIAERRLEALRGGPFEVVFPPRNVTEQVGSTTFYVQEEAAIRSNASFLPPGSTSSTSTRLPVGTDPNVKHLRVTIRWNGGPQGSGALWVTRTFETSVMKMVNP